MIGLRGRTAVAAGTDQLALLGLARLAGLATRLGVGRVVGRVLVGEGRRPAVALLLAQDGDLRGEHAVLAALLRTPVAVAVRRAGVVQPLLQLLGAAGAVVVDGALELEAPLVDAGPRDDDGLAAVGVDALVDLQVGCAARIEPEEPVRGHVHVDEAEGEGRLPGIGHLGHARVLHTLARVDEVGGDVATGQTQTTELVLEVVEDLLVLLLVGEPSALGLLDGALELSQQLGSGRVEQDGAGAHDLHSKVIHYGPSSGKSVTAGLL